MPRNSLNQPPFAGNVATARKLAHFRKVGAGDPMWSGSCIYGLSGQSPSVSEYDSHSPYSDIPSHTGYRYHNGVESTHVRPGPNEPTTTRDGRVSAHFDSLPAARFFQGTFSAHWSGMMAGFRPVIKPRPLVQSFNPNQTGSKELHPATQYRPFPPMGSLVPAYGEQKAV